MSEMSNFGSLLFYIICSACDKINASAALIKTGYGRNLSFFSSILAEEELAKLIMLPIIREIEDVQKIVDNNRNSIYFKHGIKQKIFTSFGLQNRTYEQIEELKQRCLYVGIDKNFKSNWQRIKPKEAIQELEHASNLLFQFSNKILLRPEIGQQEKEGIQKIIYLTSGLLKDVIPGAIKVEDKLIEKQIELMKQTAPHIDGDGVKIIMTDPFAIISLFKFCFPTTYKEHLKKIMGLNYEELCEYCIKNIKIDEVEKNRSIN